MNVLIIEKEKTIQQSLSYFMGQFKNCEIFLAHSKKEGLSLFELNPMDVVLCGDRLSDGSGLDILTEWMKENPKLITVLMTVQNDERLNQETLKAGIQACLVKPFDLKQLEEAIGMGSLILNEERR
jgi:DNA-binding NtrC family response regulator